MKIIIAFDSFKGCITSAEAAEVAKLGIKEKCPDAEVVNLVMADGGEGMNEAIRQAIGGDYVTCLVHDPLMRPIEARYLLSSDCQTAFIEMAMASGLTLLKKEEQNPLKTTTYGTGELMMHALSKGCRQMFIGLGGSATNDAGLGMLQAMGCILRNREDNILPPMCGRDLHQVETISALTKEWNDITLTAICDVHNPLCGRKGAAHVFAGQKGASNKEEIELLDKGLQHIGRVMEKMSGKTITTLPGSGAAGGMGAALLYAGATLKPGIDFLLDLLHFDSLIADADLILTGEGQSDKQTLMGKAAHGILLRARQKGIPVWLLSGQIMDEALLLQAGFQQVIRITPDGQPLQEALRAEVAKRNLKMAVKRLF